LQTQSADFFFRTNYYSTTTPLQIFIFDATCFDFFATVEVGK